MENGGKLSLIQSREYADNLKTQQHIAVIFSFFLCLLIYLPLKFFSIWQFLGFIRRPETTLAQSFSSQEKKICLEICLDLAYVILALFLTSGTTFKIIHRHKWRLQLEIMSGFYTEGDSVPQHTHTLGTTPSHHFHCISSPPLSLRP